MGAEGGASLSTFFEAWGLFRAPTLTATVAAALLGVLGVYVVLRRLVFLSAAVSQAAGLGVALSFYASVHLGAAGILGDPVLGATAVTLLAVIVVAGDRSVVGARRDMLLGLVFLAGAAGTLALGTRIVQEIQDIQSLLFGSAVAVLPEDFRLVVGVAAVILALHLWAWRGFAAVSFDRDGARVRGLPVRLLDLTLYATLAVAISVSTRVLGALPTFAFSVLPAMATVRLSVNVPMALVLAGVVGAAIGFVGYVVAFLQDLPVGAAQTLVGVAVVAVVEILARIVRASRTGPARDED
ncbi:MAG: metal ABC transporter permease [Myxococcota bacterium]